MFNTVERIAFFVQSPFHFYLYSNTIDELLKLNIPCDIIINDSIKNDPEWYAMYESLINFLHSLDRDDLEAFPLTLLKENLIQYQCLVSPYYSSIIRDLGKVNVRMMYGLAKENWNFSWWNVYYDKILNYGYYDYERLNIFNTGIIVGNPKFDQWFSNSLPSREHIASMFEYNYKRKTILYAPTYGDLSSIDIWLEEISELQNDYNVIVKLHHGTAYLKSENNRRSRIKNLFANVVDDRTNLLELLQISDFVISDNSGIIFDALLANKDILLLNTDTKSNLTNSRSLEQVIRQNIPHLYPGERIKESLENANIFKKQKEFREINLNTFFAYRDGKSASRAAEAIINALANPEINIYHNDLKKHLFK